MLKMSINKLKRKKSRKEDTKKTSGLKIRRESKDLGENILQRIYLNVDEDDANVLNVFRQYGTEKIDEKSLECFSSFIKEGLCKFNIKIKSIS